MQDRQLIIAGASARAAAFAAARSGYEPYWIDQFGDSDLSGRFAGGRIPSGEYPDGIIEMLAQAPEAPLIYTGALENHTRILKQIESERTLLGNAAAVCAGVRDPFQLADSFKKRGIPHPIILDSPSVAMGNQKWLKKSIYSAGGMGVSLFNHGEPLERDCYLQQFIDGESFAAVYLGDGSGVRLLGVTRQLTGVPEFNAADFSYCGTLGPLRLTATEQVQWLEIGRGIVESFGLRGLFGVDAISRDATIFPVEVNPRYTASVEALELAMGMPVISMHCQACRGEMPGWEAGQVEKMIGKAYLFAPREMEFPLLQGDHLMKDSGGVPNIADVPAPGSIIQAGEPVMTLLVAGEDELDCRRQLLERAALFYCEVLT